MQKFPGLIQIKRKRVESTRKGYRAMSSLNSNFVGNYVYGADANADRLVGPSADSQRTRQDGRRPNIDGMRITPEAIVANYESGQSIKFIVTELFPSVTYQLHP
jgi:hypothetical protein